MEITQTTRSGLYQILSQMGLLSTEDYRIRAERAKCTNMFTPIDLQSSDIERVGYLHPHIELPTLWKDKTELWYGDKYLNPKDITWINANHAIYVVLNQDYDDQLPVMAYYNPAIIFRYSNIQPDLNPHSYVILIDTTAVEYAGIENIESAAFYISENVVCIPKVEWIDETTLRITATYHRDIDFFICGNIVSVVRATANKGVYVDQATDSRCYHDIVVDHSPSYPIDTRFYPCIKVDKDCTIRVYNTSYHTIQYPDLCRLIQYPEFLSIKDPYNTDNEYMNTITPIDDVITAADSDNVILEKFAHIAKYCYRLWRQFPYDCSKQADMVICDNNQLNDKAFIHAPAYLFSGVNDKIISIVPAELHRDLLLYDGQILSDYTTATLILTSTNQYTEYSGGSLRYLIPPSYDINRLTIVKFNVNEDTSITNLGEYVNPENILQLHTKINRFYRNLLILKEEVMTEPEMEKVHISTEEPTADNYLWFQLLVNSNPEMFSGKAIEAINLFGLDPTNMPSDVREGAYQLALDPEAGPDSYQKLMMTYFKLSAAQKKYLAITYGDGETDPRIQVIHSIKTGKLSNSEINAMVMEDPTIETTATAYKTGTPPHTDPNNTDNTVGDLYVQNPTVLDTFLDENMNITMDDVTSLSGDQKLALITSYMDDNNREEWTSYLTTISGDVLDILCYRVLRTGKLGRVWQFDPYPNYDYSSIEQRLINAAMTENEPITPETGELWVNIPAASVGVAIKEVITRTLYEAGLTLPQGVTEVTTTNTIADMALDYGAHYEDAPGVGEEFQRVNELDTIVYGDEIEGVDESSDIIWYEFLDEIEGAIAYVDDRTMIIRANENLIALKFDTQGYQAFAFDDIMINFHGNQGVKYNSLLADLINSEQIKMDDVTIFHKRLITNRDTFDPRMRRLYAGTSYVVSTANVDMSDVAILYSTNIKRFRIDYSDESTSLKERDAAYRMCIDYSGRNFAFLDGRMIIFINGKYIPRKDYSESYSGIIQLTNFHEIIATVDILYSDKDEPLMQIKRIANTYWERAALPKMINPELYRTITPIINREYTLKGYYDILLNDYIFNGKLLRILNYLQEHPEEADSFINMMTRNFHAISDTDQFDMEPHDSRIIIPGEPTDSFTPYGVSECFDFDA